MNKENTAVFESGKQKPEHSPPPEARDLSPLVKEFEFAGLLANNGHVDQLTPENFPTIPKDELAEFRFVSYSMRIMRWENMSATTENAAAKESFRREAENLKKLRDDEIEKSHSKVVPSTTPPTPIVPPQRRPGAMPQANAPENTGMYL